MDYLIVKESNLKYFENIQIIIWSHFKFWLNETTLLMFFLKFFLIQLIFKLILIFKLPNLNMILVYLYIKLTYKIFIYSMDMK
jgi:hypothetical protein